jgi:hypothetical protein
VFEYSSSLPEGKTAGVVSVILRTVIGLNFALFALSFFPWIIDSEFANRLFNPHHTYGFRCDFVWMFFSTIAIFFAMFGFVPNFKESRRARMNVYLCLASLAAFLIYIFWILLTWKGT